MTPAEEQLWLALRGRAFGVSARSQHVILGWIVDFYFPELGLVVEVDGDVHDLQAAEDARRTEALEREGLRVLRVRNEDVFERYAIVLGRIRAACAARNTAKSSDTLEHSPE